VSKKIVLNYHSSLDFDLASLGKEDILIFWGDFLHAHHYLKNDLLRLTDKRRVDLRKFIPKFFKNPKWQRFEKDTYLDWTYEFYLLQGAANKHWKKTISFGTTLIGDHDFELMKQKNYMDSFTKFIRNLDRIWTRDIYSALQAAHIRQDYSKSYLGVDTALLISPEDYDRILDKPTITVPSGEYIVTHFARTDVSINLLLNLADRISEELEMPLYWLPWLLNLDNQKFKNMEARFRTSIHELETDNYSNLIHSLKHSSLVLNPQLNI
jgi:hypothetical protein